MPEIGRTGIININRFNDNKSVNIVVKVSENMTYTEKALGK